MKIGADYLGNGRCEFTVWAPLLKKVQLRLIAPQERLVSMGKDKCGYWHTSAENVEPGNQYLYRLNGDRDRPDPASNFQPLGVHQASQVIVHNAFAWEDKGWKGVPIEEMVIYELHVGTFTPEGTLAAIVPRLNQLKEMGIMAIEIMPVAQFPGERNWGYDGVYPFAVQNSYGGPNGLKQLVNECHKQGLAVILDVVYNHLGPEGNYLWDYGPYFTDKYKTPWGQAFNYDDAYSDGVRNFFHENAIHWLQNYHMDALRLDAIHAIYDMSAKPFLQELAEKTKQFSRQEHRKIYLIAESDLNDSKVVRSVEYGGYGMDAHWSDGFHHALHTLLTGERQGYYLDFGKINHLSKALREGAVYTGQYSEYRKRRHGNCARYRDGRQLVVCSQNHDQVGNRMLGERLSQLVSFESLKLAAGVVLLSPYVPLLFMGEEYGENTPFLYFVSHGDQGLTEAVRKGRQQEFAAFHAQGGPPDPQAMDTFAKSKIAWDKREQEPHQALLKFYRQLLQLRKQTPALASLSKNNMEVGEYDKVIWMKRWRENSLVFCAFSFHHATTYFKVSVGEGRWQKLLDSAEPIWNGSGSSLPQEWNGGEKMALPPWSVVLYLRQEP
jgi:maltooligosyltrehalose trehalohydrolase